MVGGTLAHIVLTRVVITLGATPRIFAMFTAPRVATVATVSTLNILPVSTAPRLVRTFVLLDELSLVTASIGGSADRVVAALSRLATLPTAVGRLRNRVALTARRSCPVTVDYGLVIMDKGESW